MQRFSYESLFRAAPDACLVLDRDLVVLDANKACLFLIGCPLESVLGRSLAELIRPVVALPEMVERLVQASRQCLLVGGELSVSGLQFRDGSTVVRLSPLFDARGALAGLMQTISRPEIGRGQSGYSLDSARFQALGRLADGVAHAFNNALQVIGGNLQLLRRTLERDVVSVRRIDSALEGVERGGRLASQLLEICDGDLGREGFVEPGPVLEGMREFLDGALGPRLALRLSVAPSLWPVRIDRVDYEGLILHLVAQGRSALGGRGQLEFRLQNSRGERAGCDLPAGDYVEIHFAWRADGVEDARPAYMAGATGMLALDIQLIAASGAYLGRAGGPQSSGCVIYLPRYQGVSTDAAGAEVGVAPSAPTSLRVLFVEDDPTLRLLTSEVMTELGHRVALGETAEQALDLLAGAEFDVLFTDIGLPGMDGLELVRRARALYPRLAVVVASGYAVDDQAEGLGRSWSVLKPYDIDRIRQLLEDIAASR